MNLESDSISYWKASAGWLFIKCFIMKPSIAFSEKIKDKILQNKFSQSRYYLSVKASSTAVATDYSFNFSPLRSGGLFTGWRSCLFLLTRNLLFKKLKFLFSSVVEKCVQRSKLRQLCTSIVALKNCFTKKRVGNRAVGLVFTKLSAVALAFLIFIL